MAKTRLKKDTVIHQPKKHKILLGILFFSFFLTVINLFFIMELIREKNLIIFSIETRNQANIKLLEFSNASNKIPFLVEKYVYTLYSKYLQNYWSFIESPQKIDESILSLVSSPQLRKEIDMIMNDTQTLRKEEIHALKLVFSAYHIPEEVINPKIVNYQLSEVENKITDAEKLKAATEVLFNPERQNELNKIQNSIEKLRYKTELQSRENIANIEDKMLILEIVILSIAGLLLVLVGIIFWMYLIYPVHMKPYNEIN